MARVPPASFDDSKLSRMPLLAPLLAIGAVAIHATLGAPEQLIFARDGFAPPDLARLFSCHLVHWNWEHLLWDATVFAVVGSWCERLDRRAFAIFLAVAAFAIPLIVLAVHPEIVSYAGLSGLDVGAVMFGVCVSLFRRVPHVGAVSMEGRAGREWLLGLLGAAVVAKVIYELLAGRTVVFDESAGFVPVPLAHLVGVCVGLAVAIGTVVKGRAVRQDRTG